MVSLTHGKHVISMLDSPQKEQSKVIRNAKLC